MRHQLLAKILPVVFVISVLFAGCTHRQLRFNTIHQADTLNDVYRRQVLDNLAMFVCNPESVPHFALAATGSSSVSDSLSGGSPLDTFRQSFSLTGSRSSVEAWGLIPISDPLRLQMMRCAYQTVIGHCDPCIDCCSLEAGFTGATRPRKYKVLNDDGTVIVDNDGIPVLDPLTKTPFVDMNGQVQIDPRTQQPYALDEFTQCVSIQGYDCDDPCNLQCGWFCKGRRQDVPKCCQDFVGHYNGVFVWVMPEGRGELGDLVLKILQYATQPPPSGSVKEVTLLVGPDGQKVDDYSKAVGMVKANLRVGDHNDSVLYVSPCNRRPTASDFAAANKMEQTVRLNQLLKQKEYKENQLQFTRDFGKLMLDRANKTADVESANNFNNQFKMFNEDAEGLMSEIEDIDVEILELQRSSNQYNYQDQRQLQPPSPLPPPVQMQSPFYNPFLMEQTFQNLYR